MTKMKRKLLARRGMCKVTGVFAIGILANICRNAGIVSILLNGASAAIFAGTKTERISNRNESESGSIETEPGRFSVAPSERSRELNMLQSAPAASENSHRPHG